jgi:predicted dehydrogenase
VVRVLFSCSLIGVLSLGASRQTGADGPAKPLRAGIIGCDTSHVIAFTRLLNRAKPGSPLAGVRVVAAFPGGSSDVSASSKRVAGFTRQLRDEYQVEIVGSIEELLPKVDVVLLESVDGRPHLKQAVLVFKAHKPVFIDKPIAASLADAMRIFELARQTKTPCFSSSSLRFSPGIVGRRKDPKVGDVLGCDVYGPCELEAHHPDLFWYGIHGVESLFTIMGTGCRSVARVQTRDTELAIGVWKDGRAGTFRGIRKGKSGYGGVAFGTKGIVPFTSSAGYEPLVEEICEFFRTGQPPVSAQETLEIYAFMEAADESKRQGGRPVTLESVMARARAELQRQTSER